MIKKQPTHLWIALCCALVLVLVSCAPPSPPPKPFQLTDEDLQTIAAGQRLFPTAKQKEVLEAAIGALQDINYTIDASSVTIGVVTGTKEDKKKITSGTDSDFAGILLRGMIGAMHSNSSGVGTGVSAQIGGGARKEVHSITQRLMITVRPQGKKETLVRITMQEEELVKAYDPQENHWSERIYYRTSRDAAMFQKFFNAIDQSLFLDKNKLS